MKLDDIHLVSQKRTQMSEAELAGYVHVYSDRLDIHHDLDFDLDVCRNAEVRFYSLGFRSVEHYRP